MRFLLQCLLLLGFFGQLAAQKTFTMTEAINNRAAFAPTNLRQIEWVPGTNGFTYTAGKKLVRTNAASLATDTLDVLTPINEALTKAGQEPLKGMPPFKWLADGSLWFHTAEKVYAWDNKSGLQLKNTHPDEAEAIDYHEKTYQAAYVMGNALLVSDNSTVTKVAESEGAGIVYGKSVHRDEFGIFKGTFWSESGQKLAFYRMDESMVTEYPIYVLDSMPATERKIRYPYAGATSHHVTVGVFDTRSHKTIYLQTGEPVEQYLTNVAWSPDDKFIIIAVVNRAQNHLWLNQYDAATGAFVKTIFEETNEKWVEPEKPVQFVPGSNTQFVYQSERDGFNHLYLGDLGSKMLRQVSTGKFPITNFYGFSTDGKRVFYQTADETGLNRHIWTAMLKDGKITRLTEQTGTHNAIVAPDGNYFVDVFSDLTTPRTISVCRADKPNSTVGTLLTAPSPIKDYKMGTVRFISLQSTDDGTPLNARLVLPADYDPARQYPALVYVYNGPHVQMVTNTWLGGSEMWMHRMANEGYAILSVDGRGSSHRGRDFEQAIHRRLGDLEMADQLAGVSYLKSLGFIDPARIGVYGWSYGGFMATSLLTRPEAKGVFKCGVAGGPVLDWRMYEIMYTERYMDTPQENPEGYQKNTLYNYIDNLDGRLLMIHGTSDNVVLWQHSLKYVRTCVKKGKQLDYFVYPEHEHNVAGPDRAHLFVMLEDYFKRRL
jgi:dipeptidyl-peptidase 4